MEAVGIQRDSTRDGSQDPLSEEKPTMARGPNEVEPDIDMTSQDQDPAEDNEITITAILKEKNRSISSKNSSIQEGGQEEANQKGNEPRVIPQEMETEAELVAETNEHHN